MRSNLLDDMLWRLYCDMPKKGPHTPKTDHILSDFVCTKATSRIYYKQYIKIKKCISKWQTLPKMIDLLMVCVRYKMVPNMYLFSSCVLCWALWALLFQYACTVLSFVTFNLPQAVSVYFSCPLHGFYCHKSVAFTTLYSS